MNELLLIKILLGVKHNGTKIQRAILFPAYFDLTHANPVPNFPMIDIEDNNPKILYKFEIKP
jgi:hypothetical protein